MSRAPFPAFASCALTLGLAAGSLQLQAEDAKINAQAAIAERGYGSTGSGQDFRNAIQALESSQGAYADQLSEYLGGLGLNLQRRGEHREAVEVFKRGVHVARINEGLYCLQQIPLLEREIASHIALGEYTTADERQQYLYRVQMHNFAAGPNRARAFMQQANWQYTAYQLGLERDNYARLMNMWDLNNLAFNDLATQEGNDSPQLIGPLEGMLQAQYLISDYTLDEFAYSGTSSMEGLPTPPQVNRFNLYRAQSFRRGQAVAEAMFAIQATNFGADSPQAAEARAVLGDWLLFHGQREAAQETYEEAVGELLSRDDAEAQIETLFGQPVELPDEDGIRILPPAVTPREDALLLRFSVSAAGKVGDLERLDDNDLDKGTTIRIMRTLRHTRFRPRLATSGPEDAEVVRAYVIN